MTQLAEAKQWLTLSEAAIVARRSERTIRNWVRDGVLRPAARGMFGRDAVLAAERAMRARRGRPTRPAPRVLHLLGISIEVIACPRHAEALKSDLVAASCGRCRLRSRGSLQSEASQPDKLDRPSDPRGGTTWS